MPETAGISVYKWRGHPVLCLYPFGKGSKSMVIRLGYAKCKTIIMFIDNIRSFVKAVDSGQYDNLEDVETIEKESTAFKFKSDEPTEGER